MTHVTCRLTAKYRDLLRNPTLGNRVRATFFLQSVIAFDRLDRCFRFFCLYLCLYNAVFFVAKSWPAADRISRRSVPRRRGRGICGGYSIIAASVIASIVAAAWRVAAPSVSHSISSPGGATERPDDDRMREPRDSQSRERSLDRTVVQLRLATPPPPAPGRSCGSGYAQYSAPNRG